MIRPKSSLRKKGFKLGSRECPAATCLAVSAILLGGLAACTRSAPPVERPRAQAVPVTVSAAVQKSVPVDISAIGSVEAYSRVEVRPQVTGVVEKVLFREGQDVKSGDLLFTLNPAPFQAALDQLEADLARDRAQLENARAQADRSARLFEEGIVSKEQYDAIRTNAASLAAAVQADEAAIKRAKIDLGYCSIRSPLDGRTGTLLVDPGNVVKANDTALVTINQIHPIYVTFAIPEKYLDAVRRSRQKDRLQVTASIPGSEGTPAQGTLSFLDNTVDQSTGTIKLKATFANADNRLWPGQFVTVALRVGTQDHAVVVPSQAVQTGQAGQYLFVVKPDLTAESRPVVAGLTVAGETVIERGVQAGEQVVVSGQLRLIPGAKVEVKQTPEGNPSRPS